LATITRVSANSKVFMLLDHKPIWKIAWFQILYSNETKIGSPLITVFTAVNVIKAYKFRI
jgi:hypothetical protein